MAIIEMAQASGLNLLSPAEYNPMKTTTLGTGELIKDAVRNKNIKKIILGLGGSATVDVGLGILSSLGIKFVDKNRKAVHPSGSGLGDISDIIITSEFNYYMDTEFIVASDVTNPLIGPEGAAGVYAPQKGASLTDVKILERNICQFCRIIKLKQKRDISSFKGGGAAGGIAAGLKAFFDNVTIKSGAELFFELVRQKIKIKNYDLIITGEGKVDSQTLKGKAVKFIIDQANANGKDVIIICGKLGKGYKQIYRHGVIYIEDIMKYAKDLNDSMTNTAKLIEKAANRIIQSYIPPPFRERE